MALRLDPIHIGVVLLNYPDLLQILPPQYHKLLLVFAPKESRKLPDKKGCDHRIEVKTAEENFGWDQSISLHWKRRGCLKNTLTN